VSTDNCHMYTAFESTSPFFTLLSSIFRRRH
jgi:hypothetical protein